MIFIGKISKGHNSVKAYVELQVMFSAHRLMMIYIIVQSFMKIFSTVLKLNSRHDFHSKKFKGAKFRKKCWWSYDSFSLHIL